MNSRTVLVTGSSKGIGRAIALRLGRQDWRPIVHYGEDAAGAESVAAELGERCAGVVQFDLADPASAADSVAGLEFDALVNNAGVYLPLDFADAAQADFEDCWTRTMAINLESPMRLMRVACERFASRGEGRILNVCSRVGFKGEAGAAFYAASKAALINLTRSLAVELAGRVRLHALAPGWVETAMARDAVSERHEEILATLPLGRMASVDDCAACAAFLLSDEAAYLSGQCIDINGASYFH